jgi:hypothetical protein
MTWGTTMCRGQCWSGRVEWRHRVGLAGEHVVSEGCDDVVNGVHALGAQFEHLVQGWSRVGFVRHARVGLHLIVREAEWAVGLTVAEDRAAHPRVGGEDEVAQRLDEGVLAVSLLVQQVWRQALGALDGGRPRLFDDRPRLAEAVRGGWVELSALRVAPVELGLDERTNVDAVDPDVADLAVDVDVVAS